MGLSNIIGSLDDVQSTEELLGLNPQSNEQNSILESNTKERQIQYIIDNYDRLSFNADDKREISMYIIGYNEVTGYAKIAQRNTILKKIDKIFRKRIKSIGTFLDKPKEKKQEVAKSNREGVNRPFGQTENNGNQNTVESVVVDKKEHKNKGGVLGNIDICIAYLELNGKTNSEMYQTLIAIKKNPEYGYYYQEFNNKYIFEPLSRGIFEIENSTEFNNEKKAIEAETQTYLGEFKGKISMGSVEGNSYMELFTQMGTSRKKIQEYQNLNIRGLLAKKEEILQISFDGTSGITKRLQEFINNTKKSEQQELLDFLGIEDNLSEMIAILEESNEVFNDLKKELNYLFSLSKDIDSFNEVEQQKLEKAIKGCLNTMLFINGLDESPIGIHSFSITGMGINRLYKRNMRYGIGATAILAASILSKHYYIVKRKRKLNELLGKQIKSIGEEKTTVEKETSKEGNNSETKKETSKEGNDPTKRKKKGDVKKGIELYKKLNLVTGLENLELEQINQLISEMENKSSKGVMEIKDKYSSLETQLSNLKQLRDVLIIIDKFKDSKGNSVFKGVKLNNNLIFLSKKGFARELILELAKGGKQSVVEGTVSKGLKLGQGYLGLGVMGRIGDIAGYKKLLLLGKNRKYFNVFGSAQEVLQNFIDKIKTVSEVSTDLDLLRFDESITEAERKKVPDMVTDIQERFINKNIIIAETIANKIASDIGPLTDQQRLEITSKVFAVLEKNNFFTKTDILSIKEGNVEGVFNKTGAFFKNLTKLIVQEVKGIKFKSPLTGKGVDKLKVFKFGDSEIEELLKKGEIEFNKLIDLLKGSDGKIDRKIVQKEMVKQLNKKLTQNLDNKILTKEYFEILSEKESNPELKKRIKELSTLLKKNDILKKLVSSNNLKDYIDIDGYKDFTSISKIDSLINKLNSLHETLVLFDSTDKYSNNIKGAIKDFLMRNDWEKSIKELQEEIPTIKKIKETRISEINDLIEKNVIEGISRSGENVINKMITNQDVVISQFPSVEGQGHIETIIRKYFIERYFIEEISPDTIKEAITKYKILEAQIRDSKIEGIKGIEIEARIKNISDIVVLEDSIKNLKEEALEVKRGLTEQRRLNADVEIARASKQDVIINNGTVPTAESLERIPSKTVSIENLSQEIQDDYNRKLDFKERINFETMVKVILQLDIELTGETKIDILKSAHISDIGAFHEFVKLQESIVKAHKGIQIKTLAKIINSMELTNHMKKKVADIEINNKGAMARLKELVGRIKRGEVKVKI